MAMKRYRFNERQKEEYNRRVKEYTNENYFLKDAKIMARRDVENMIYQAELEGSHKPNSPDRGGRQLKGD